MCRLKDKKDTLSKINGFTLIEMSIVITILGLIIASAATAYTQWQKFQRYETTQNNVENAQVAIENFLAQNGRYPCPAPLTTTRTDLNLYGAEPPVGNNCNTAGAPPAGVFLTASNRTPLDYRDPATGADIIGGTPNVRIGTIPFRALGLNEEQAYDGYRNRLFYAVTEHLASADGFEVDTGGITVQDNAGVQASNIPNSVHYLVFSAGVNGAGAYTREGVQIPCPAGPAVENENCDLNDPIFTVDDYSTSNDANNLDDIVAYGATLPPTWRRPQGGNPNVAQAALNNVGMGVNTGNDPQEELDVTGTINLQDDPLTPELEGQLKSQSLCDYSVPNDPDCFDVSAITGLVADGEGMECSDPDEYIVAIENNNPVCDVISVGCPNPGEIILGVDGSGNVDCGTAPADCPSINVNICSQSAFLPTRPDGSTRTVSVTTSTGGTRSRDFRCRNGGWSAQGGEYGDPCNCTPATLSDNTNISCVDTNYNCGDRFTGTYSERRERECPSGNVNRIRYDDNCTCIETTQSNSPSCTASWGVNRIQPSSQRPPSGYSFNTGNVNLERRHRCPQESCTGWQFVSHNCGCANGTPYDQPRACSNGFPANEIVTRQFVCAGGEGAGRSGRTEIISIDDSACTCSGTQPGPTRDCSTLTPSLQNRPGSSGVETTDTFSLDGSGNCQRTRTDNGPISNYCQNPPPRVCVWTDVSGTNINTGSVAFDQGEVCDCDANAGATLPCNAGSNSHYRQCTCN